MTKKKIELLVSDSDNNELLKQPSLAERVQELEKQAQKNNIKFLEQEHRVFSVFSNLVSTFKKGCNIEKSAALKALFYLLLPGRVTAIIAGGAFIGLVTVILMQKNNELITSQNFYFQEQNFTQYSNNRSIQISKITEYLYSATEKSKTLLENWELEPKRKGAMPELMPLYDKKMRQVALREFIEMSKIKINPPQKEPKESFIKLAKRVICENLVDLCQNIPDSDKNVSPQLMHRLKIEDTLLQNVKWPDTESIRGFARGSNMRSAEFINANLENAILVETTLLRANLDRANLKGAFLMDANLQGARLTGANLTGASLKDANLEEANLEGANLEGANLKGANLKGANLLHVDGLICAVLKTAKDWKSTHRDENLSCEMPIQNWKPFIDDFKGRKYFFDIESDNLL